MSAAQLQLSGHNVKVIICDRLPYSEKEIVGLPSVRSYRRCFKRTKRYCKAYGISYLTINAFLSNQNKKEAYELSQQDFKEIENYKKNGINLWDYAKRNHSHYFKGDIKPKGEYEDMFRKAFESAYLIETAISKILSKHRGYEIVSANGRYIQTGIPIELNKNLGNSFYTYEVFRQGNGVIVDKNRCSMEQNMDDVWDELKLSKLSVEDIKRLYQSFDMQQKSINLEDKLWDENIIDNEKEIISLLGIDARKKIIACYPNVFWDSVHMGLNSVSKDLTSWLEDMINFVKDRDEFQLIIRTHPAELKAESNIQSKFTISDSLNELFDKMPSNVIIIEPKSNVSSYALANIADANIVWNGTIGLELALNGSKPIVIADAYYAKKGFTIDFLNFDDLANYLNNLQEKSGISKEEKRLLEIFSYNIRFKRKFNPPYYYKTWNYLYRFSDIRHGKNKALDNFVGFLLDQNSYMNIGSFDFD
tara:strand:- start:8938 stop:10365 length:1428 start_codon:yes stop_codon:yes gene_type:complete